VSSPDLPESAIRFAEFAVDFEAGELHRNGAKVKLQGQPFEILALLLKRPGRVVTREELRRQLWPTDTFVDFEHGLNAAVNRLREALGDSAEEPRFIETVPRRGYRFIAPLNNGPATSIATLSDVGLESATATLDPRLSAARLSEKRQTERSGPRCAVLAGAVLLSAALLGYIFTRPSSPPRVVRYLQLTSDTLGKSAAYANELPSPLVTDGSRLYFMEGPLGVARLAQVSTAGGDTVLFPAPFRIRRVLDISPNRHELLVSTSGERLQAENPLMVLPLPVGSPHRLDGLLARIIHEKWSGV
jgi:DNA-binding winged helix-turn-helix (wHTH) protein